MRFDAVGLFWEELDVVKPEPKQVIKRLPPERTWERPEYLPELEQARLFPVQLLTDEELVDAAIAREPFIFDTECYSNYFLACFRSQVSHKLVYFEQDEVTPLYASKLQWVIKNLLIIGFNSRTYDMAMLQLAEIGASCVQLKELSDAIILGDTPGWEILKNCPHGDEAPNHIDLIEVAPLDASLKGYGGRLHAERLWDLPFPPATVLSAEQKLIVRWYCVNDLDLTETLEHALHEQLTLRATLGQEYGQDLRSKSDAQIAEAIIGSELRKRGVKTRTASVAPGTVYKYEAPGWVAFTTPALQAMLEKLLSLDFEVAEDGYVQMPPELTDEKVVIGAGQYQMGIGGLHSCEKSIAHISDEGCRLEDRDVASYYPSIILNCGIYPEHLGPAFLDVYRTLVVKRLEAKRAKNKVVADSLKITINGTFGKLGSQWSILYAPNLLFQVTITGQLGLLMLIESLEQAGVTVVSANTDGIVSKIPRELEKVYGECIAQWEKITGFETEDSEYTALYSRDVNNYIALKKNGGSKNKGAFANPWAEKNPSVFRLHKNPVTTICIEALEAYLRDGVSFLDTIRACSDVKKFLVLRAVRGGAVKDGLYLGKTVRWYYRAGEEGVIIYATSGNKVPKSEGAMPLMVIGEMPCDVDYLWYERECMEMLKTLGKGLP